MPSYHIHTASNGTLYIIRTGARGAKRNIGSVASEKAGQQIIADLVARDAKNGEQNARP